MVVLITACQTTVTSTPHVSKNTATATQAPEATEDEPLSATVTPTTPSVVDNPDLETELKELQGAEVSIWHGWSGGLGAMFEQLVTEFNVANEFDITATAVYQGNYNELYEKVSAAISAGDPPEVAVGYNYALLSWNQDGETLVDLNDYIRDRVWGFSPREIGDFYPVFWDRDEVNSFRLGVPAQSFGLLMYYNTSWAQDLGFENPPRNPRQFKQQACAAAQSNRSDDDPENDGTGGWVANTSPSAILSWIYAFGGEVVNARGTGYQFGSAETEEALAFLKDLRDSGCTFEINAEFGGQEFATRQALFISASIADLPDQRSSFEANDNSDTWTVIPFPSSVEQGVIDVYGPAFGIFRSTEREQLAAWMFLKWFLSPEVQARWVSSGYTFPLSAATRDNLRELTTDHSQLAQAFEMLPYARNEPKLQSWSVVRWVVSDVGTQMFRSYFTPDRIPASVELLDETAEEINQRMTP